MKRALTTSLLIYALALTASACGDDGDDTCLRDSDCDVGFECDATRPGERGLCIACPDDEVPYDGMDNDCDPGTPDLDIDEDGDNAADSPIQPGGDCNDMNPNQSSTQIERCNDDVDNDCDGMVDEEDCDDRSSPLVEIISPRPGDVLTGTVAFEVMATDDTRIATLEIFTNDVILATASQLDPFRSMFTFVVDSRDLSDGSQRIIVEATDISGKDSDARVEVEIDNSGFTDGLISRPNEGGSYGGTVLVEAVEPPGVTLTAVEFFIGSTSIGTSTGAPHRLTFNSRVFLDGATTLRVSGTDSNGDPRSDFIEFNIDNTGPDFVISPPESSFIAGFQEMTIDGVDDAGILEISAGGQSGSATPFTFNLDTTQYPEGPFQLVVSGRDNAIVDGVAGVGNEASQTFDFVIDQSMAMGPTITWVDPVSGGYAYRLQRLEVSVGGSGTPDRVAYSINGSVVYTAERQPWTGWYDFTDETGTVDVTATVYDSMGNFASSVASLTVVTPAVFRSAEQITPLAAVNGGDYDTGDIDGDGNTDLVVGGRGLSLHFAGNSMTGPSWRELSTSGTAQPRVVDLDNDGYDDILYMGGMDLEVIFGDQGRTLSRTASYSTGFSANAHIGIGDVDGDNDPDVVVGPERTAGVEFTVFDNNLGVLTADNTNLGIGDLEVMRLRDVDDDGDLDVIAIRSSAAPYRTVSFLNDGTGAFENGRVSFTTEKPEALEVADVTGDGFPDVILAMTSQDQVWVLPGNNASPGQFGVEIPSFAPEAPTGIVVADLDGINGLDIIVSSDTENTLTLMANDGNAEFAPIDSFIVSIGASNPRFLDYDGDGTLDLLAASDDSYIGFARGLGGLSFDASRATSIQALDAEDSPRALEVGDFVFGGSATDIVVTLTGDTAGVLRSIRHDGGFEFSGVGDRALGNVNGGMTNPTSIKLADVDGVNGPDLLIGSTADAPSAELLLDNGAGDWNSTTLGNVQTPRAVDVADVNGDSLPELVFSERTAASTGRGVVLQADGSPSFATPNLLGPEGIVAGEFDGNTSNGAEWVVSVPGTDTITLFTWDAQQQAHIGVNFASQEAPRQLAAVDINQDSRLDVVAVGADGAILHYASGNAAQVFDPPELVPAQVATNSKLLCRDVNGDGYIDILLLDDNDLLVLVQKPSGSFFAPDRFLTSRDPQDLRVVDFDGDGGEDVVILSEAGTLGLFERL